MLNKITFSITFSNGQSLTGVHAFDKGSYLVTGKNGKGKSLMLELFAFALFGSVALRGVAGDYKKIAVSVEVTIKGNAYTIERTKSHAKVFSDNQQLVDGVKPVGAWMQRTLGFNYSVFRIAHWCAQGDIQALASMKPSERKDMINSVTGLTQMEAMVEDVSGKLRVARSVVQALEERLVKPEPPLAPMIGLPTVKAKIAELESIREKFLVASSFVLGDRPEPLAAPELQNRALQPSFMVATLTAPEPPACATRFEGVADLDVQNMFDANAALLRQEMDLATKLQKAKNLTRVVDICPELSMTKDQLATMWTGWETFQRFTFLSSTQTAECPNCSHEFHLAHKELAHLHKLPMSDREPSLSIPKWEAAQKQLLANFDYQAKLSEYNAFDFPAVLADQQEVAKRINQIQEHRRELKRVDAEKLAVQTHNAEEQARYDAEHAKDLAIFEQAKVTYANRLARYELKLAEWEASKTQYTDHQEYLANITDQFGENPMSKLRQDLQVNRETQAQYRVYEQQLEDYRHFTGRYEEDLAELNLRKDAADDLNKAKQAIAEVKLRVQSFIVPSLNRVASYLISEMTGGAHTSIELTQDFELLVDNNPVRTLSGSGKDIANLALRIALGRILTHRVLPMMMLDEIDSAMDEERAMYTWQCIQKITPQIGQVIQASHKNLVADNVVEVGSL